MATTASTARTSDNLLRSEQSIGAPCSTATCATLTSAQPGASVPTGYALRSWSRSSTDRVLVWRPVHDHRSATTAGFAGSPTLLINGVDPLRKPASIDRIVTARRAHRTRPR